MRLQQKKILLNDVKPFQKCKNNQLNGCLEHNLSIVILKQTIFYLLKLNFAHWFI